MYLIKVIFLDPVFKCVTVAIGIDALEFKAEFQAAPCFIRMIVWHYTVTIHSAH